MQKELDAAITHPQDESCREDPAIAGALVEHELDASNPTEQRARTILQLFRALAIGKTIAVIGSGVSTIYGYPDWKEFVDDIGEELVKTDQYVAKDGAGQKIKQLRETLDENKNIKKDEIGVAPIPSDQSPHLSTDELLALFDEIVGCLDESSKKKFDEFLASRFNRSRRYHVVGDVLKSHPKKALLQKFLKKLPKIKKLVIKTKFWIEKHCCQRISSD